MSSSSSCLNSASAATNFSLSSFQSLEVMSGPCVTMCDNVMADQQKLLLCADHRRKLLKQVAVGHSCLFWALLAGWSGFVGLRGDCSGTDWSGAGWSGGVGWRGHCSGNDWSGGEGQG